MNYISLRGTKGYEQSRRDDLESLGYMLASFIKSKGLPWNSVNRDSESKTAREIEK